MSQKEKADVVIIGSGAGGAPVAYALAQAGVQVVVLEKGPYYNLRDFSHDEIGICRRNFFIPYHHDDPHMILRDGQASAQRTNEGWTSQCVGGATVHMSGFYYRLKASDFKLKSLSGGISDTTIADWPISLNDLNPFYDLLETIIGVSGQTGLNPFASRQRPYPLPPLRAHPLAHRVDQAAQELGLHAYPTARSITSTVYGERPPCNYCGYCGDYGCENGSKSSVLATFIPMAESTGHCQVRPNCMVKRILCDKQARVNGVEYIDQNGHHQRLDTRVVVLAASAIESARLLLLSTSKNFPQGLANQSGLVGKHLNFSTFGKGTAIMDRGQVAQSVGTADLDLPFLLRSIQDHYWLEKGKLPSPKGGTYNFIINHPNPINAALRLVMNSDWTLRGQALKQRLQQYFHHEIWLEFEIFGEFLPHALCYVDLDPTTKDKWELPVARIHLKQHNVNKVVSQWMVQQGLNVLHALKPSPTKIRTWAVGDTTLHLQHGTCRFGDDPEQSVLNPYCQAHDVNNLFVTDGSFMPTSGGVPATPTIMANALRVAKYIRDSLARQDI